MRVRRNVVRNQIAWVVIASYICFGPGRIPAQKDAAGIGHGTTGVILRSRHSIYAAVDSKLVYREYRNGQLSETQALHCKLKAVGPYYALVAGTVLGTNGFNAQDEIAQTYTPGRSISELLAALRALIPVKLVPMFQTMRDIDPVTFDRDLAGAELEVALIGMEHSVPTVGIVEFHAVDSNGKVSLSSGLVTCPGSCPTSDAGYFLGTHEAIEASIRTDDSVLKHPSEDRIRRLIDLEYAARPDVVGGPVAMIRISSSGSSVLREGVCSINIPEGANIPFSSNLQPQIGAPLKSR